jgi:hypothetical protein
MLFTETVAVIVRTIQNTQIHSVGLYLNNIYKFRSYLTGNILHLRYKDQPVNAV